VRVLLAGNFSARWLMGMAVGGAKRGTFVEINVVPLIDVLLVLLVIFMIIPHQRSGLQADLPEPSSGPAAPEPDVVEVEVLGDSSLRINQKPIRWEELSRRLEQIFRSRENHTAFIRGNGALEFQVVARVISVMHAAGAISVGLMTPGLDKARHAH
jgi:biopolymer transport protein ExbD